MEKRKIITFTAIAIMLIFSISFAEEKTANQPQIKKSEVEKSQAAETFRGRVIFLNSGQIEIKNGKAEITFNFKDSTIFVSKTGEEKNKDILALCQTVKAFYILEGDKNLLQKIIVQKESNCIK
jgi:hypothetical protein